MIVRIARAKVGHRQAPQQVQSPSRTPGRGFVLYSGGLCGDLRRYENTPSDPPDPALHCQSSPLSTLPTRRVSVQANFQPHRNLCRNSSRSPPRANPTGRNTQKSRRAAPHTVIPNPKVANHNRSGQHQSRRRPGTQPTAKTISKELIHPAQHLDSAATRNHQISAPEVQQPLN